jgi:hypothetical protein
MKDDVKVIVPSKTPRTLILLNGVVNWDGVLKFGVRPNGDHATHFLGWMKRPIAQSLVWKYS